MLLAAAGALASSASAQAAEPDFNHDGYADLVVSATAIACWFGMSFPPDSPPFRPETLGLPLD